MKTYILTLLLSGLTACAWAQGPATYRYTSVRAEAVKEPGTRNEAQYSALTSNDKRTVISYFDGFGRPVSQFAFKANPGQHDLIKLYAYDNMGRVDTAFLPYAANLNGVMGNRAAMITALKNFYNTPSNTVPDDAAPFAVSVYEKTAGNFLKEQGAPGAAWQPGSGHTAKMKTQVNAANEIRIWREDLTSPGFYAPATLVVQQATDENGNITKAFLDQSGHLIEKHVQAASSDWLITRNIYDRAGRLRYVLQPEGVVQVATGTTISATVAEHQTFQYTYDSEGRLVEMKVPGTAPVYYGYDPLGRLTLLQDGNLRAASKWMYIKYDRLGRPVMNGLYLQTTHTTRVTVQENVLDVLAYSTGETFYEKKQNSTTHGYTNQSFPTSNTEVLTVNYYDDYDVSADGMPDYSYTSQGIAGEGAQFKTAGALTASKSLIPGTTQWLYAYIFYDAYGRMIQQRTNNQLSATADNLVTYVYDFEGKLLQAKTYHATPIVQVTVLNRYVYDLGGRVTKVYQKNNSDAEVLLCAYVYNELGTLIDKKLHSTDAGVSFLQSIDYRHNIRGWLASINNAQLTNDALLNDDDNDLFGMELLYNTTTTGLNSGTGEQYYNGNISAMKWKGVGGSGSEGQKSYKFNYDKADRLLQATYGVKTASAWTGEANAQNETMTYDRNGNIKTLARTQRKYQWTGVLPEYTSGPMDDLTYTFADNGNRLVKVEDAAPGDAGLKGFANGAAQTTEYTYDISGNLTADKNKGIDSVKYTVLGKVSRIKFSDGKLITYQYSAGGVKLTQKNYQGSTLLNTTHYVNGFVYENDTLRFFGSPGGRVVKTGSALEYQYAITDHQGNTRIVFSSAAPAPNNSVANFEPGTNAAFQNYTNRVNFELMDHTDVSGSAYTYSQKLTGGLNSQVGVAKSMKVYPGDKVKIEAYAKYYNPSATGSNLTGFAAALTGAFGVSASSTGEALKAYTGLNNYGGFIASGSGGGDVDYPKAFVTILLFDKDHNLLDASWEQIDGGEQVGVTPKAAHDYMSREVIVKEPGYAYVFVSNESPTLVEFYVDDVTVTHTPTNVIQYNEYYPFGLQTSNSWTRDNTSNRYLYNGGTELNATSGWYETMFRGYDAVLGRFLQVDALAASYAGWTPYAYGNNNPVRFNDPTGLSAEDDAEVAEIYRWMNRYGGPRWSYNDWSDLGLDRVGGGGYFSILTTNSYQTNDPKKIANLMEALKNGASVYDIFSAKSQGGSYFLVGGAYLGSNGEDSYNYGVFFLIDGETQGGIPGVNVAYVEGGLQNTYQAMKAYIQDYAMALRVGNNVVDALILSKDFQSRHSRIVSGKTTSMTGNFSIDLTSEYFFVGRTNVDYTIACASGNCTVTYDLFVRDGFWDVDFVDEKFQGTGPFAPDGLGPNLERGGTPYPFIPIVGTSTFTNPGYK